MFLFTAIRIFKSSVMPKIRICICDITHLPCSIYEYTYEYMYFLLIARLLVNVYIITSSTCLG
jgi:hypothetical protein